MILELTRPYANANAEGPAVLRLRMLEVAGRLRTRKLSDEARIEAEATLARLREAVLSQPHLSFADLVAKLRTQADAEIASVGDTISADRLRA